MQYALMHAMMHGVHQGFGSATFYPADPEPEPNMVAEPDPAKVALD